jgi:porin
VKRIRRNVIASGVFWIIFATISAAQSATSISDEQTTPSQRPGENPYYRFHAPFPPPVAEKSEKFHDKYLFGDWLGVRSKFASRGIKFTLLLIADPFGNVTGGQQRGASDYNLGAFDLTIATDRFRLRGGTFHVGCAVNFGASLSRNYIGNSFPVQLADVADAHPRLTYLSYTQALFEDKLSIRLGRLTLNSVFSEEFLASEYFKAFSSVGVDLVPLGIFMNAPGAFGYPDATWGARVKFEPVNQLYMMIGAYNGDPKLKAGALHGVDFSLRGPLFLIGELGLRRNYGKESTGLAGNLKFGGYYNGGTADVFGTGLMGRPLETERGRYGLYVVGDQMLVRWGDSAQDRHLGAFGAFTFAPNGRINKVPFFFDTGLVLYGPSRRRPKDFAGFAVVYGSYSGDLRRAEEIQPNPNTGVQNFEMTLEWNYGWAIKPGVHFEPDVQYIIHPNGNKTKPNAVVIGVNIILNL